LIQRVERPVNDQTFSDRAYCPTLCVTIPSSDMQNTRLQPIVTNPMPEDFQAAKVCRWGRSIIANGSETLLATLVGKIFSDYVIPEPDLEIGDKGQGSPRRIAVPQQSNNLRNVLLHECAHAIAPYYAAAHGRVEPWHGPTFVRVFISLLVRYGGHRTCDLLAHAKASGIQIAPANSCLRPPKQIRDKYELTSRTLRRLRSKPESGMVDAVLASHRSALVAAERFRRSLPGVGNDTHRSTEAQR
jgi:hypothetical protein